MGGGGSRGVGIVSIVVAVACVTPIGTQRPTTLGGRFS